MSVIQQFDIDNFMQDRDDKEEVTVFMNLIAGFALSAMGNGSKELLPLMTRSEDRKNNLVRLTNSILDAFYPTGNVLVNKTEDRYSIKIAV